MDTRSKILDGPAEFTPDRPLVLVTGYFDVLVAAHARELQQIRDRAGARTLLAAVLPSPFHMLSQRARSEMVAALRMVDYVVTADVEDLDRLTGALQPAETVRLEAADGRRTRQLIEHVSQRHTH